MSRQLSAWSSRSLVVDLVGDEAAPEDPRHRPEQRPGVGAEGPGLDQRDARPAAEVASASRPRR